MASVQRMMEDNEFLRSLNETLMANQKDFKDRLAASKEEVAAKEAKIRDLQEQVIRSLVILSLLALILEGVSSHLRSVTSCSS